MKTSNFPEVGWMKERFQVLHINDNICEFEWVILPGGFVPEHLHKESNELFKVLEGKVDFKINDQVFTGHPGFELSVPKMNLHSVKNNSKLPARCLVTYSPPADQGKFFQILHFLAGKNPKDKYALFKAMYIADQMVYKEFSTVSGLMAIMQHLMLGVFKWFSPFLGWNKLAEEYRREQY